MVLIGLGVGGVKATISPFIGDQYKIVPPQIVTTKEMESVIVDRTMTIQYIYNVFYWFTNIGSLSLVASTYLEKEIGFWAAFLFSLCSLLVAIVLLLLWNKDFVILQPQGNILTKASKVIACSWKEGFRLNAARPTYQHDKYNKIVAWDDHFIDEMKRGLLACRVMACFALFYLGINQISNNLVSQAGQMELGGIPNDAIQMLNPIACIILGPLIQNGIYSLLYKHSVPFGPIARMTAAFLTMSGAMAYAAGVQKLIYTRGPCFDAPLVCIESQNGAVPNQISVWVQTPVYFLLGFAEVFGFATLSEYSYSKAPKDMRTVVQALRQVTAGVGSALGMALSPVAVDPKILWMYSGLAVAMFATAPLFWIVFIKYDRIDEQLNELDVTGEKKAMDQEGKEKQ